LNLKTPFLHRLLTALIAIVWIVNGLFAKLLNFVPRHRQIVSRILDDQSSVVFTRLIGLAELIMAIWIISGFRSRLNAICQIIIIATMNILEFFIVPDLLLFGRFNSVLALVLIGIIYYNEFVLKRESFQQV
jgi:hypothetical protein